MATNQAIQTELQRNQLRRLSNTTASTFSYLEQLEAYLYRYIDELYDSLPGLRGSIFQTTSFETGQNIESILRNKFQKISGDLQFSYSAARREAGWWTDEILSYRTRTYPVTGGQFMDAWNGKHNPLANEKELARRINQQSRTLLESIRQSADNPSVTAKQAKDAVSIELGTKTNANTNQTFSRSAQRKGNVVNTNGIFWEDYRVIRTEQHRLSSIAETDNMNAAQAKGADERLRKKYVDDARTREQSRMMGREDGGKGQLSDSLGRFIYPGYSTPFRMGDAPPEYSINDRGWTEPEIIGVSEELQDDIDAYQESGQPTKFQTYREWAAFNQVEMNSYVPPYEWP